MLIQYIDYGEKNEKWPITKFILNYIKDKFPLLIHSVCIMGIIISYTDYNNIDIQLTDEKIGLILGYPCFTDKLKNYDISVYVLFEDNSKEYLFTNYCDDLLKKDEFKNYANKADEVFKKYKNNDLDIDIDLCLDFSKIKTVDIEINKTLCSRNIIDKLIINEEINDNEKKHILNIFYNMGYSENFQLNFMLYFNYDNGIHKGMLITLLLNELNDTLSPFYPLYKYQKQSKMIEIIIEKMESEFLSILLN